MAEDMHRQIENGIHGGNFVWLFALRGKMECTGDSPSIAIEEVGALLKGNRMRRKRGCAS